MQDAKAPPPGVTLHIDTNAKLTLFAMTCVTGLPKSKHKNLESSVGQAEYGGALNFSAYRQGRDRQASILGHSLLFSSFILLGGQVCRCDYLRVIDLHRMQRHFLQGSYFQFGSDSGCNGECDHFGQLLTAYATCNDDCDNDVTAMRVRIKMAW